MAFGKNYTLARADIRLTGKVGVVKAAGTDLGADAVRVIVDNESAGNVLTKEEVLLALDIIKQSIVESDWPPP